MELRCERRRPAQPPGHRGDPPMVRSPAQYSRTASGWREKHFILTLFAPLSGVMLSFPGSHGKVFRPSAEVASVSTFHRILRTPGACCCGSGTVIRMQGCVICDKHHGIGPLVSPVIHADDLAVVTHRPAHGEWVRPGYLFVEPHRHVATLDLLDDAETVAFARAASTDGGDRGRRLVRAGDAAGNPRRRRHPRRHPRGHARPDRAPHPGRVRCARRPDHPARQTR